MKNVKKIIMLIVIVCISIMGIVLSNNIRNSNSLFESISFSGEKYENYENYNVKLYRGEECYYAFIPDEISDGFYVNFSGFEQIQLGEQLIVKDGERITDIFEGESYKVILRDKAGNALESGNIEFYFGKGIPSVYIKSKSGSFEVINEDKNKQEECRLSLGGNEHYKCKIKARGNTSFLYNPKSYSIDLKEECSLLGMSPCSEWVLLGNYSDCTQQLRNKIVLDIADRIGMKYTPESRFVNVYIDNQYNGVYLLAQKVSADGGAVKIDSENGDGYLLEFDARYEQEQRWFLTDTKNIVIKSPKVVTDEELKEMSSYLKEVEETVLSKRGINDKTHKKYNEYIDMDTWTKMFLMQDFFVQWDVEYASFYLYKENADSLIYAGPVWDFDYSCGYMWRGYYPKVFTQTTWISGGWLAALNKFPEFSENVKGNYINTLIPCIKEYLAEDYKIIIEETMPSINMSIKRFGKESWSIAEFEELYTWIDQRSCFLENYLQEKELYRKIDFHFGWGEIPYYVKVGDSLGFLPLEEYGEIDYYTEGPYGYGVTVGWIDETGKVINPDTTIAEDMELYPVYQDEN